MMYPELCEMMRQYERNDMDRKKCQYTNTLFQLPRLLCEFLLKNRNLVWNDQFHNINISFHSRKEFLGDTYWQMKDSNGIAVANDDNKIKTNVGVSLIMISLHFHLRTLNVWT